MIEMATRYDTYASGKHQITMGGITNELWADVEDYSEFVKILTNMKEGGDFKPLVNFTVKLIKKGTPPEETQDPNFENNVRRYLFRNVAELADELTIAFGIASREKLEQLKAKAEEKLKKKDNN